MYFYELGSVRTCFGHSKNLYHLEKYKVAIKNHAKLQTNHNTDFYDAKAVYKRTIGVLIDLNEVRTDTIHSHLFDVYCFQNTVKAFFKPCILDKKD